LTSSQSAVANTSCRSALLQNIFLQDLDFTLGHPVLHRDLHHESALQKHADKSTFCNFLAASDCGLKVLAALLVQFESDVGKFTI
jgi:hypothetical protein